ncbi:MAG: serine/threonine protein kinase [Actinobacteria bacterium]|nr:serine/threonine protein kinase [Actinomycetota bacterium]
MESVGGYELEALIGRGAAGTVWRAHRPGPVAQAVAVKRARVVPGAAGAARLRDEAAILAELDHPHIVRILDVLEDGDDVAIVMQLAKGGSLRDLLAERGTLGPGQVVALLAPVASALGSAHRNGVLHGDVKPANILFTTDGEPLLSDFGVARNLVTGAGATGQVAGTAAYLDPELLTTGRPEPRNDIYALGVVAYLMLTGHLPHDGPTIEALLLAADQGRHASLRGHHGVPEALGGVVESAIDRSPGRRPATAEDLAHALRSSVAPHLVVLPGTPLRAGEAVPPAGSPHDAAGHVDGGSSAALVVARPAERVVDADLEALVAAEVDEEGSVPGAGRHGTRLFGPRPPGPPEPAPAADRRGALVAVFATIALLLAGLVWWRARAEPTTAVASVDVARRPPTACPELVPVPVPAGARRLRADLRGDGCPVPVVWTGTEMDLSLTPGDRAPRRFDVRRFLTRWRSDRLGGQLVFGDWNCDGVESPALYDPGSGAVYYFARIPLDDRTGAIGTEREDRTGLRRGEARVSRRNGGCDEVVVARTA